MKKPSMFIVSSGRAATLATQLQRELQLSRKFLDVGFWKEDAEKNPGTTITQRLERRASSCDFVAVLLTQDDIATKKDEQHHIARDNCIFEAGLFTGALGLKFERCFLISSVNHKALPTDLQELQYVSFEEPGSPESLEDDKECREKIRDVIPTILSKVEDTGAFPRLSLRLLATDELMELESLRANLKRAAVVVNSTQPLEVNYPFAHRVMENMRNNVRYLYFLHGNRKGTGTDVILEMIQMLSFARLMDKTEIPSLPVEEFWRKKMEEKRDEVVKNLGVLQGKLRIHFLAHEAPLQFCVHNADLVDYAKCYLRYSPDQFVQWHENNPGKAMKVAEELLDQRLQEDTEDAVFRSTKNFDLNDEKNKQLKQGLFQGIEKYFIRTLWDKAREVCFGKASTYHSNGGSSDLSATARSTS
jgi:hypothetical protein